MSEYEEAIKYLQDAWDELTKQVLIPIKEYNGLHTELARRDEQTTNHLKWMSEQGNTITGLRAELKERDEIIARLKEDGDRLIGLAKASTAWDTTSGRHVCQLCERKSYFDSDNRKVRIDHAPDCPITLHRALMKELEDK